jgi:hypothetical protein
MNIRQMKTWPAVMLSCLLLTGGCGSYYDYERTDILVGTDVYLGRTMSHYKDVEVTKSGILLKPGARFSVQNPQMTQFLAQVEVAIISGEGMTAYIRTVPHDFDTSRGIAFRYAVDGCSMRMPDGQVIPLEYNAQAEQQILSFYNEASLVSVSVGCDRLVERPTDAPGTDYVIFETLPGSTVELRSINYFSIDPEE